MLYCPGLCITGLVLAIWGFIWGIFFPEFLWLFAFGMAFGWMFSKDC